VAKGVRKPTSRKAGHLELFAHSRLLVARGRNLDIVTQAELIEPFERLREDLTRVGYAFHMAELVMRLTEEEIENPALFDLLLDALGWLAEGSNLSVTSRYVELRLLDLVGYRPQLFRCVQCNDEIRPVTNYMSYEEGGVLCPSCGERTPRACLLTMPALKILRFMQTRGYATCRRLQLRSAILAELEEILGNLLAFHMESKPRSLAFVRQLRREAAEDG